MSDLEPAVTTTTTLIGADTIAVQRFAALGTTATVCVRNGDVRWAGALLRRRLAELDRACSRFRPDSEVWDLARARGRVHPVSATLAEAIVTALEAARATDGAVDPTVGRSVIAVGYDRDFREVVGHHPVAFHAPEPVPAPGWWRVEVDAVRCVARVPAGTLLDLGATAKALAADRAASELSARSGLGVLVDLGGDLAVAGPGPAEGWPVGIAVDSGAPLSAVETAVAVSAGGVASSSPMIRAWGDGDDRAHHIVDPGTGCCVEPLWKLVTVAADSCVAANTASTASVVWGADAPSRLTHLEVCARLVDRSGAVAHVGAWPVSRSHAPVEPA